MELTDMIGRNQGSGFPSPEVQMARIEAGALGQTISFDTQPPTPVKAPQPQGNLTSNIDAAEIERLRGIDTMLKNGELVSRYGNNQNETSTPQSQEAQGPVQDQNSTPDWMAQFDTSTPQNEFVDGNQGAAPQANDYLTPEEPSTPQTAPPTQEEIALINEGAKRGISGDAMIDFARKLSAEDYLTLYEFKQSQLKPATSQANAPVGNQTAPTQQSYQPRYFERKPTPGPAVANLTGAPTKPTTTEGVSRVAGTGAMNYRI